MHLLFDIASNDGRIFNPKLFEQKRRDKGKGTDCHKHEVFTSSTKISTAWRSLIDCRQCKRSIIEAIGLSFMQTIRLKLKSDQTLYLSGCFPTTGHNSTYRMSGNEFLPTPDVRYKTNSDEADMRIWRHKHLLRERSKEILKMVIFIVLACMVEISTIVVITPICTLFALHE